MTVRESNLAAYVTVFIAAILRPRAPGLVVIQYRLPQFMGYLPGVLV
jgi:hypothetical protein